MVRLLSYLFNIRAGEWPRVIFLYFMGMLFIIGATYGETTAEAAFLSQVGVKLLPLMFVADALIAVVAIAVYSLFVDRISNQSILMGILGLGTVAILIGRGLIQTNALNIAYPFLYLLSHVVKDTFTLHWWTYTTGFYDARASKRVLPVIVTNARVGGIIAGLTLPMLIPLLTAENVIILWAVMLMATALVAALMSRLLGDRQAGEPVGRYSAPAARKQNTLGAYIRNLREGYQYISKSSFLRWMAVSTFFLLVLVALLNFYNSSVFLTELKTKEAIASYISDLTALMNLLVFVFQLLLFSRIVNRVGLGNANLMYPLGTLAIAVTIVAVPGSLAVASLAYFSRVTFRISIRNTIDNLLYNAVPLRVKGRARAFISGLIVPIGSLVGGGVLLLLPTVLSINWLLPAIILALALAYVITTLVIRRQYARALVTMLEQEDYSFLLSSDSGISISDPATLGWLKKKIDETSNVELKLFMARLVADIGGMNSVPILMRLAKTDDEQIRASVVDILVAADLRGNPVHELMSQLASDPSPRVRRAAVSGMRQWADQGSSQFLELALNVLSDPELDVSLQVIPPLLRSGDSFYVASAMRRLAPIWVSDNPAWQAQGIQVLGQANDARYVHGLVDFLSSPDSEIRVSAAIAIETLVQSNVPRWISDLLSKQMDMLLNDPVERIRRAGLTVLGRVDPAIAPKTLVNALTDDSPAIRDAAVEALVQMGKPIIPLLTAKVNAENPRLRKMATVVLSRIVPAKSAELIRAAIQGNLHTIYSHHVRLAALAPCADSYRGVALTRSMFSEQSAQLLEEVFYLLSAANDPKAVQVIAGALNNEAAHVRANALEAIESMTSPQIAQMMAPLYDRDLTPQDLANRAKPIARISDDAVKTLRHLLSTSGDLWARTLAGFSIGEIWNDLYMEKASPAGQTTQSFADTLQFSLKKARDLRLDGAEPSGGGAAGEEKSPEALRTSYRALFPREALQALRDVALADPAEEVRAAVRSAEHSPDAENVIARFKEGVRLSTVEKIILLKKVSFFEGMTIDQLKILADVSEEELFTEGNPIYHEGDPGGILYVVVQGKVGIEVEGARKGSAARIATAGAYSYFGEMRLFDNSPRSEKAIAVIDTLALHLRREPLVALMRQYPDLALKLINVLSQRLREVNDRIVQLTVVKPRELHKLYDQLS